MKYLLLIIIFQCFVSAEFYGVDDRLEAFEKMPPVIEHNIKASVALIPKERLIITEGKVSIVTPSLIKALNMCESSRFSSQPLLANCSGGLIGKQTVLTAAHCLPDKSSSSCEQYYYVFDYEIDEESGVVKPINVNNIYECEEIIHHNFDETFTLSGLDLALVKLSKPVFDRKPYHVNPRRVISGEEVFMIGYPLGIPKKVSHNATVKGDSYLKNSFSSDLDTYSVNSGSPIFDRNNGGLIGVLVRGTGANVTSLGQCNDWSQGTQEGFADGNDLLSIKKLLKGMND